MNIDLSDIIVFIKVAELKNMSAAANQLNYLQSNVTTKVKKIENHYKRQLFTRHSKGVELNEAGLQIYQYYKKIMLTWDEAEFKLFKQNNKLRFGTNTSLGGMYFYPTLRNLYDIYPALEIKIRTGETSIIESEILDGQIDLGYILGFPNSNLLNYELKLQEQLILIGKSIRAELEFPKCLENQNIILASDKCYYAQTLEHLFKNFKCNKGELIQVYDHETMIEFTQIGMGISIITNSLLKKFNIHHYRHLPEQYQPIGLYLITRKNHVYSAIEKQFVNMNDKTITIYESY